MRTSLVFSLLVSLAIAGCASPDGGGFGDDGWHGASSSGASSGSSSGGTAGSSGAGSSSGSHAGSSSGGTASGDAGSWTPPPPSQPAQPGGYQQTLAPLLDAQGCTECHHHGRPIDLTTYPFMAGTAAATAAQLVASLTGDMPPSPRTPVTQAVVAQVNAWIAAGMKP